MADRTCITCSAVLPPRKAKHCSPLCASRAFNAARKADGRRAAQVTAYASQRAAWMAANKHRYMEERTCACGAAFTTVRHRPTKSCPSCRPRSGPPGSGTKKPRRTRRQYQAGMRLAKAAAGTTWLRFTGFRTTSYA